MRLNHPRISPLPESEWSEATRARLESLRRDGRVYNIFSTLAHHSKLLNSWLVFGSHILSGSTLPARDREIVILRAGWLCRAEYEWGHHVALGKQAGLSGADIDRIKQGADAPGWEPFEAALLRAVDELHADSFISDATWQSLSQRYNTEQLFDFLFTVGEYKLVSMVLNSVGVQLEAGFEGFANETEG